MYEPNLGIYRSCCVCGDTFWCDDGDTVCSPRCDRELDRMTICEHCDGEKESDQEYCDDCTTCSQCGDEKSIHDSYCNGDRCCEDEEEE